MKKTILLSLLAISLVAAGCKPGSDAQQGSPVVDDKPGYTMAEVMVANTVQKCWAAIDGQVYDLTDWIAKHPGGPDKIVNICGTDATEVFKKQHGGFQAALDTLATYKIDVLAQ